MDYLAALLGDQGGLLLHSHLMRPLEQASLGKAPWELVSQERAKLKKRIRKLRRWESFLSTGHVYQRLQFEAEQNRNRIHILM